MSCCFSSFPWNLNYIFFKIILIYKFRINWHLYDIEFSYSRILCDFSICSSLWWVFGDFLDLYRICPIIFKFKLKCFVILLSLGVFQIPFSGNDIVITSVGPLASRIKSELLSFSFKAFHIRFKTCFPCIFLLPVASQQLLNKHHPFMYPMSRVPSFLLCLCKMVFFMSPFLNDPIRNDLSPLWFLTIYSMCLLSDNNPILSCDSFCIIKMNCPLSLRWL